jgi:DNA-binding MarR family transcriptional regulator
MSRTDDRWPVALAALRLGTRVIEEIQTGVKAAGFGDVTPLHGFAFARIAAGDATTADLAEHLGVTKQAAAQLTERLVQAGYVSRSAHPRDSRARLLILTPRGRACTEAARAAAETAVERWREELPPIDVGHFESALLAITASIPILRPPT